MGKSWILMENGGFEWENHRFVGKQNGFYSENNGYQKKIIDFIKESICTTISHSI